MDFPVNHRRNAIIFFLGVILLFLYLLFVTLKYPYMGLTAEINKDRDWKITVIDPLGWGQKLGVQKGDKVKSINGHSPENWRTLRKYGDIEKIESIELIRETNSYTVKPNHQILLTEVFIYHTVLPSLLFLICLGFCVFIYRKKGVQFSALILILFFLSVGFSYVSAGASARNDDLGKFIVLASLILIPVLFIHFLYQYFKESDIRLFHPKILSGFYGAILVLLAVQVVFWMGDMGSYYAIPRMLKLLFFSLTLLFSLYVLFSSYIRLRKTIYRPVFKILGFGIFLSFFPFICLVAIPSILLEKELIPSAIAGLFLIFLPLTFMYLILSNRLLDIDFFVNRLRYYSILSLQPVILIMVGLYHFVELEIQFISWIRIFLLLYMIILTFLYLKENLSYQLRSRLFIEKYNFQASLDRLSQYLSQVKKVADLEERLVLEIKEVLRVKESIVLETDKTGQLLRIQKLLPDLPKQQIKIAINSDSDWKQMGSIIQLENGYGVCMMIGDYADRFSLVWISEKVNRTEFNRNEMVWLKTVAHYVNMVYKNLALIEGLVEELQSFIEKQENPPWVSRLLFNLSEKERRRLSSDLHDAALQDQLLWFRKLESIVRDKETPSSVKKELEPIKEGLLDVIYQIRETCNELRPPFLVEKGIVEVLENLFEYTKLRTNFMIRFHAHELDDPLDDEQTLAIYRIVQELLTNAEKHSRASVVEISLFQEKSGVCLVYKDNGIGIKPVQLTPSFQNMGISGMKERVRSLNGTLSIKTDQGQGLEVSAWIPINIQQHSILSFQEGGKR